MIKSITSNYILNVSVIAWAVAQILKGIVVLIKYKRFDIKRILEAGGMPSSHTALVVAMTVAVGRVCGIASPEFAISFCISGVVMYDASGVRRAAGEQAKIINYIMEHWNETTPPEMFEKELKELLGHTPLEVLAGTAVGLMAGLLL